MRLYKPDISLPKGWYFGPWNSSLGISIGYANQGIDEPHLHKKVWEIYLVASGFSEVRIEQETYKLQAGDILIVEPGEAHTFINSSGDYFHFVIHSPALSSDAAQEDKLILAYNQIGLPPKG